MTDSRVRRGRRSEVIAADYLRPIAPNAEAVGPSLPGRDIRHIPGLAPEVKARNRFEPLKAMTHAERHAGGDIPMVVLRMAGQGEESIGDWLCMFRFKDARKLMETYGSGRSDRGAPTETDSTSVVHREAIRMGFGSIDIGRSLLERVLSPILHELGCGPGDYEVLIHRREGGSGH